MALAPRAHWDRHVEQIIRSKHYTWLGEGLAGEQPASALTSILADIMHICAREGLSWDALVARGRAQFEREEAQLEQQDPLPA
ncbi:MAG: hypothetical protein ACT4QC_23240 [Planctomycetaceae bacterium]